MSPNQTPSSKQIDEFHEAMLEVYRQAKLIGYTPSYFLIMVEERGGLQTAKDLINASRISEGFEKLWQLNRLDLSVEAVVLKESWKTLFSKEELEIAQKRLDEVGYKTPEQ